MTSAPTPPELLAERFDVVVTDPDRARFLQLLQALAAWLIAHPELPAPNYLSMQIKVDTLPQLQELAAGFDAEIYGEKQQQFSLYPLDTDLRPAVTVYTPNPERAR